MKQKYSLMIADIQLSVVTDAPHEEVEKIVGILDRRMREINLKSRRCSKNEAALLCALDFCAERLEYQEKNTELETRNEKYAVVLEGLKAQVSELRAQVDRLTAENDILRSVIGPGAPAPVTPPTPSEFLEQVAAAGMADVPPAESEDADAERSDRVGSMFDLLTFEDV
jgi:cell division protein ZapA (FtsZ GTPase activity inhibitor)